MLHGSITLICRSCYIYSTIDEIIILRKYFIILFYITRWIFWYKRNVKWQSREKSREVIINPDNFIIYNNTTTTHAQCTITVLTIVHLSSIKRLILICLFDATRRSLFTFDTLRAALFVGVTHISPRYKNVDTCNFSNGYKFFLDVCISCIGTMCSRWSIEKQNW